MVTYLSIARSQPSLNKLDLNRFFGLLLLVLVLVGVASAQNAKETIVISGTNEGPVVGLGKSVKITGSAQEAVSLGGDVIVEGVVEGDVAAVGGSVIQKAGARIGGDVMVIGGSYRSEDPHPNRNPASMTMMYAGYEQELSNMMNNPTGLFSPRWTSTYLGTRLLVVLFWFLVSLGFTAAMRKSSSTSMTPSDAGNHQPGRCPTAVNQFAGGCDRSHRARCAIRCCAAVPLDYAAAGSGNGRIARLTTLAGRRRVRPRHSVCRHRAVATKKICRDWKEFRGCGVITRDEFLGTVNLAPLRVALYGSFNADYQLWAGIDGALPRRLE